VERPGPVDAADLFTQLERQMADDRRRSSRSLFRGVVGVVVGLTAVLVGLSTNLAVSVAGYGLALACSYRLAVTVRAPAGHHMMRAAERFLGG
jgi:hypothetical protein